MHLISVINCFLGNFVSHTLFVGILQETPIARMVNMIEKNHQSKITIIVEDEERHHSDTQVTDRMTFEKGVVRIQSDQELRMVFARLWIFDVYMPPPVCRD